MRHSDRDSRKAVILKGETYCAQQLRRNPKTFCRFRRDVVELQADLVDRVQGFTRP
jgi:hypothetical protein